MQTCCMNCEPSGGAETRLGDPQDKLWTNFCFLMGRRNLFITSMKRRKPSIKTAGSSLWSAQERKKV